MEQKLDIVLRSHEMNFLESYRNHMRHIKRDLEKYKKALNEKDFENRKDDKVQKLQDQIQWFKNEALAQSKLCFKLKEEKFVLEQEKMMIIEERKIAEATANKTQH